MDTRAKLHGIACWSIFAGMLVACLWPFHSPRNQVTWLAPASGVRFGRYGTVLSRDAIRPGNREGRSGWSLEIWLRPSRADESHTILAFYHPGHAGGFSLHQSITDLTVESGVWNEEHSSHTRTLYADEIFLGRHWLFVSLVSGWRGTRVYLNGKLIKEAPQFRLSPSAISGRLILANSPVASDGWSGELRGLALYSRDLTREQVMRHYSTWTRTGQPAVTPEEDAIAIYRFNEGSGNVAHNQVASGGDLYIPTHYLELHHILLERPWHEFYPGWSYCWDVLINIAGFIPFGFLFYGYLSLIWRLRHPTLVTIAFGCLLSVTVEVLQAYLPTRDSGMTDIVTNTLGAAAGVGLWRCATVAAARFKDSPFSGVRWLANLLARDQQVEIEAIIQH